MSSNTITEAGAADLTSVRSPAKGRWYALVVLTLVYSCHFLDRAVISLVAEPLRHEFALSDSQLGLLTGLGFGLMFALAGIPIGVLVDRVNRRNLLAGVVFLWSSATAVCGLAQNYVALLVARMAVGAAESGGAPTSMSLISDYFPPQQRSTAVGFYYLGNALGGVMCFIVGSYVAAHFGWRAAFFVAGVPGILLAILALTSLREPPRGGTDSRASATGASEPPVPLAVALRQIVSNPALVCLILAAPMASSSVATLGAWLPSFFMRSHGMALGHASLVLAIAGGGFGALGSIVGGTLADRVARKNPARRAVFAAVAQILAIPVVVTAILTPVMSLSVGLAFLAFAMIFSTIPVAFGSMLTIAGPRIRGITSATMQVVTNLIGYGMGPFIAGVISDSIGGDNSLRYALAIVVTGCCVGAIVTFGLTYKYMNAGARKS
jgi:predicted MFS family arabinose efflux permease